MILMQMLVITTFVVRMVTGHPDAFIYIHVHPREISAVLQSSSVKFGDRESCGVE